jgi:hypothetical protein
MQPMAQRVRFCIAPWHNFTIHPNATITIIKRNQCHVTLSPKIAKSFI